MHPGTGEFVEWDAPMVVVAFERPDSGEPMPSSAQVMLDGAVVEGDIMLGANTVVWMPEGSGGTFGAGGQHTAKVTLYSATGDELGTAEWQFTALAASGAGTGATVMRRSRLRHNAFTYAEAAQYSFDGDNVWEMKAGGHYRAHVDKLHYGAEVQLSNLTDEGRTQDRNVYRADIRYGRSLYLRLGDARPSFNQAILAGKRIRGFEFGAHAWLPSGLNLVNLDVTYGQAQQAVSPDTYKRTIFAARTSFGSGRVFQLGLTFLSGKDDTGSIAPPLDTLTQLIPDSLSPTGDRVYETLLVAGATPEQNVVAGADFVTRLLDRRLTLYGTYAFSLYTRDIGDSAITKEELEEAFGAAPVDPSSFSWLITLNQSSLPLYNGAGILNSSFIDAGMRLDLPFEALTEQFEFSYKLQGANYHSMGNTLLGTGEQGFSISDKLFFLSNRAVLEASYGRFWNNLDELQSEPTVSNRFSLSGRLFYSPRVPSLTVTYTYNGTVNRDTTYGFDNGVNLLNAISAYNYRLRRLSGTLQLFGGWSRIGNDWRMTLFQDSMGVVSRDTASSFGAAVAGASLLARIDELPITLSGAFSTYAGGDEALDLVTVDGNLLVVALPRVLDMSAGVKVGAARMPGEGDYSFHFRIPYGADLHWRAHRLRLNGYMVVNGSDFDVVNSLRYEWRL